MGQSTDGILAYGYDLGGDEGSWKVTEADEYDSLTLNWFGEDDDGFEDAAGKRLLASVGFTEEWAPGARENGYYDRQREAEARLGVDIEPYCSSEYPMFVLAAKGSVTTAYRGDCKAIDFTVQPGWDDKLRAALEVLGLTPTQERAQWLLCSFWG